MDDEQIKQNLRDILARRTKMLSASDLLCELEARGFVVPGEAMERWQRVAQLRYEVDREVSHE